MVEPALGNRPGDEQVLVVLIQPAPGRVAVAGRSPEPFGEESLLPVAAVREVPAEERPDHGVGLEAVVEGVHKPVDRGLPANAAEHGTVPGWPKIGREVQETTVAHVRIDAHAPPRHASTLSVPCFRLNWLQGCHRYDRTNLTPTRQAKPHPRTATG